MADSSSVVAKQWDPALTAFSTVDRLRGLLVATTKDDVQISAVLAIERLGARLIVAPKLISDGVDALKGNESVRLADARLLLGLSWGGVAAQMRLSSACVRAFLLISALNTCSYDHLGIAEILYEYLFSAKLLDLEPVSVGQLTRLVDIMSGYSNALLHSVQDTMEEVIQSIASLGPGSWPRLSFEAISVKIIADILLRCFEAIQQVEGGYVEISGEYGLLWIATVLLWLNSDEVGLFSQDRLLFGTAGGKVRIIISKEGLSYNPVEPISSWKIRTWKEGKSITSPISEGYLPCWAPPRRTSLKILRRNVRHYFLSYGRLVKSIDLVGALAAGLIDAALRFGTVQVVRSNDRREVVRLQLLYEQSFLEKGGCVMEEYGWDLEAIKANATEVLARFTNSYKVPGLDITYPGHKLIPVVDSILMDVSKGAIELDDRGDPDGDIQEITRRARWLAGHALASAQATFGTLVQFYYPHLARDWIFRLFSALPFMSFMEEIYKAAGVDLNGLPNPSLTASIRSSEGRVVIPQVMLDHSTRQESLFKLLVIPGRIHYEGSCFEAVIGVEDGLRIVSNMDRRKPYRVPIFDRNTRQSVPLVPDERNTATLKYFFAMEQRLLLMRTCLSFDQDGSTIDFGYSNCIENLAVAFHATPSQNDLSIRHKSNELSLSGLDEITLTDCLTIGYTLDGELPRRIVTHVPNSQEMRFFASDKIFVPRDYALCILQGTDIVEALHSIMTCDELAPSRDRPWKIITGHDR